MKNLCIILRKCRQPPDSDRGYAPGPRWGTSVLQIPQCPPLEKNPAGAHEKQTLNHRVIYDSTQFPARAFSPNFLRTQTDHRRCSIEFLSDFTHVLLHSKRGQIKGYLGRKSRPNCGLFTLPP